jgi:RHS repeat-associated protein
MSRVTSVTTQLPTESEVVEKSNIYDINGNVTSLTENNIITTFEYDKYGLKTKASYANGLNIFYKYDQYNRLIKEISTDKEFVNLIDSSDQVIEYGYDNRNNVVSKKDIMGRSASYQYDAYGNLRAIKDFDGLFTTKFYNNNNQLTVQIDQRNNLTFRYYNNLNQLSEEVASNGAVTKVEYDALGNKNKIVNALGEQTSFVYDMHGNVLETVDAAGNKTTVIYTADNKPYIAVYKDNANKELKSIEYSYDLLGNNTKQTISFTDPLTLGSESVTVQNSYNAYGELVQSIDGRNYQTTYNYNDSHQLIKTEYSNDLESENIYNSTTGELEMVKTTDPTLITGSERIESYEYNIFGQVTKTISANSSFTTKVYNQYGLIVNETYSNDDLFLSDDDYTKTYTYNGNGQVISIKDNADYDRTTDIYSEQILETRTYNQYGDISSVTNQSGLVIEYEYDKYGRQISEIKKDVLVEDLVNDLLTTTTKDLITTINYDLLNRPIKTKESNGLEKTAIYNELGQVVSKSDTYLAVTNTELSTYDMFNNLLTVTNSENELTVNEYNGLNQLVKTTYANGEFVETVYDDNGSVIEITNFNDDLSNSSKQEYVYDEVNNLTQSKEYRSVNGIENVFLTTNTYTKFNDLASVQDPTGNTLVYEYDNMGNKTKTIYSTGRDISYTYSKSGSLASKEYKTNEAGVFNLFTVTEEYKYYIDGKLQSKSDNPPVTETEDKKTDFYYYDNGQLNEHTIILSATDNSVEVIKDLQKVNYTYNNVNQIIEMKDNEGSTIYHYNNSGKLSKTERVHENIVIDLNFDETSRTETSRDTVMYEYDVYGNQTRVIYDDNSGVDYTYDSLGRILTTIDSNGTTTNSYDTANNKTTEVLPDGKTTVKTYELGHIVHLITSKYDYMLESDITIFEQYLTYDESGNILTETRNNNGSITTITNQYNERNELTESEQVCGTNKTVYFYLISAFANKDEVIKNYENDVLVNTENKTYTYNHMNQLVEAIINGITVNYYYDAYGNLTQEDDGTTTKTYEYDLNNKLVSYTDGTDAYTFTYDGSGNRVQKTINGIVVDYINDMTKQNEQVLSLTYNNVVTNYTYGNNRLFEDSDEYLYDSYGNVVIHDTESYEYTPYGEIVCGIIDGVNEYGYKGEVHDTGTLQYLRARYYNTSLQQFISEDTYTGTDNDPISQNRYTFVHNNPFKYSDPSGHKIAMMNGSGGSHNFEEKEISLKPTFSLKPTQHVDENKQEEFWNNNPSSYYNPNKTTGNTTVSSQKITPVIEHTSNEENKPWYKKAWDGVTDFVKDTGDAIVDIGNSVADTTTEVANNNEKAAVSIGTDIHNNGINKNTLNNSYNTIKNSMYENGKTILNSLDDNLDNMAQIGKAVGYSALAIGIGALAVSTGGLVFAGLTGVSSTAASVASVAGSVGVYSSYALGGIGIAQMASVATGTSWSGEVLTEYQEKIRMEKSKSNLTAAITIGFGSIFTKAVSGYLGTKMNNSVSTQSNNKKLLDPNSSEINKSDIVSKAKSWQGSGSYPGVDDWESKLLKKGTKVWGGTPGPSNFYTTTEVMDDVGYDATKLYKGLQVGLEGYDSYRASVTMYTLNQDIEVAYSTALENPQFGVGGYSQYYIENYNEFLKPVFERIMVNR